MNDQIGIVKRQVSNGYIVELAGEERNKPMQAPYGLTLTSGDRVLVRKITHYNPQIAIQLQMKMDIDRHSVTATERLLANDTSGTYIILGRY